MNIYTLAVIGVTAVVWIAWDCFAGWTWGSDAIRKSGPHVF